MQNKKNKNFNTIISACLLGIPCRYNGKGKMNPKAIEEYLKGFSIAVCPEISGGLSTPRPACEIINGDGEKVLKKQAKIVDIQGKDFTKSFICGAELVIEEIVKKNRIEKAILKSGSPSCGVDYIYNGKFDGTKIKGCGIFAALLKKYIKNINEL